MISTNELAKLKALIEENFFFPDSPDQLLWTDECECYKDLEFEFESCTPREVRCGCTKAVFFFSWLEDYVLKLPFLGIVDFCKSEPSYFTKFKEADYVCRGLSCYEDEWSLEDNWNYCATEAFLSKEAERRGIGDLFCKTYLVTHIDGFPIYVSEKSGETLYNSAKRYPSANAMDYAQTVARSKSGWTARGEMDKETFAQFYDDWGEEKVRELSKFFLDTKAGDCHNDNVAYKDGKIRIIDCASYHR